MSLHDRAKDFCIVAFLVHSFVFLSIVLAVQIIYFLHLIVVKMNHDLIIA